MGVAVKIKHVSKNKCIMENTKYRYIFTTFVFWEAFAAADASEMNNMSSGYIVSGKSWVYRKRAKG